MSIDISRLSPAAQEQIRKQLAERRREKAGAGKRGNGFLATLEMTGDGRADCHGPAALAMIGANGRGNKLHAEKVGHYASKKEAQRAGELRLLEMAGKIFNLREQVKYVLVSAKWEEIPRIGKRGKPIKPKKKCVERALVYIADFVYEQDGKTVVEDVKGYKNTSAASYRLFVHKRKLMREVYGIEVVEV